MDTINVRALLDDSFQNMNSVEAEVPRLRMSIQIYYHLITALTRKLIPTCSLTDRLCNTGCLSVKERCFQGEDECLSPSSRQACGVEVSESTSAYSQDYCHRARGPRGAHKLLGQRLRMYLAEL